MTTFKTKVKVIEANQKLYNAGGSLVRTDPATRSDSIYYSVQRFPRGNFCEHRTYADKGLCPSRLLIKYNNEPSTPIPFWYYEGASPYFWVDPASKHSVWEPYVTILNWKKLPTSSPFGLLQFLAELDDTVAMFGSKLKQSISYGGYKWGWAPFLNDVNSIVKILNRFREGNAFDSTSRYHDINKLTFKKDYNLGRGLIRRHTWDVKIEYDGIITVPADPILQFYDMIGFHPSLSVLWDLVPLSFAVDWVLPVGRTLDQLKGPHGWVNSANFTGWRMITAKCKETTVSLRDDMLYITDSSEYKYFLRQVQTNLALETKVIRKELGLSWPTFSNTLDYAYLAKTFLTKGKGGGPRISSG